MSSSLVPPAAATTVAGTLLQLASPCVEEAGEGAGAEVLGQDVLGLSKRGRVVAGQGGGGGGCRRDSGEGRNTEGGNILVWR